MLFVFVCLEFLIKVEKYSNLVYTHKQLSRVKSNFTKLLIFMNKKALEYPGEKKESPS